jgi:hypothetical protein
MMHVSRTLPIAIGGIPAVLDLSSLSEARRALVHEYYGPFRSEEISGAIRVHMTVEPSPPFISPEGHRELQIRTWRNSDGTLSFSSFFEEGAIDFDSGTASVVLREEGNPENFLRVLYAWAALDRGGLLIHASGVVRDGKAYVFFGHSGAGKTTVARLSMPGVILSDDLVLLGVQDGVLHAYGVPFRGEMVECPRNNASAPVAGLYLLEKAAAHGLHDLTTAYALARLVGSAPFVNSDSGSIPELMSVCEAICGRVSVRRLTFLPDPGFWDLLEGRSDTPLDRQ